MAMTSSFPYGVKQLRHGYNISMPKYGVKLRHGYDISRDRLTIGQSVHLHKGPEPVVALVGTNLRQNPCENRKNLHKKIYKKSTNKPQQIHKKISDLQGHIAPPN